MYQLGQINCEHCEIEINSGRDQPYCDDCYELFFCECGKMLEEEMGESPGEGGFCKGCD